MAKKYIKSHSNFTLKRQHQNSSQGTIFERDFATTSGGWDFPMQGRIPVYSNGNFKMYIQPSLNTQRGYKFGTWETNVCDSGTSIVWTEDCLGEVGITTDSKIVLKPNYTSLLDFAYYGSALELVRASISDIIRKYPAELYFSDAQLKYLPTTDSTEPIALGGDNMFIVDNPFLIDITTKSIANIDVDNPLRYFCESYQKYSLIDTGGTVSSMDVWEPVYGDEDPCPVDGDLLTTITLKSLTSPQFKIYVYYYDGDKYYLYNKNEIPTGTHIRPNSVEIENFFSNIDDFEKTLLNRRSKPLYKAIFDTPKETDTGTIVFKESYVWPTIGDWNLDINGSVQYKNYVDSLISLATFYDEYYTDNLWRMLTHESIKNLDLSEKHTNLKDDPEDIVLGISKLEKMFKVYGRYYDDIKRYIDNIRFLNNVTYDGKNNLPDYFLTDVLNNNGWEISTTMPSNDYTIKTDGPLYDGESNGYSITEAHNEFLRRLKLNSKAIISAKGTKKSLEMIMALFGVERDAYKIDEFVYITKSGYNSIADVKRINQKKLNFIYDSSENGAIVNELQGLPVKQVNTYDDNNQLTSSYIIPWFDKKQRIDGNPYFQMKGGWGKTSKKKVKLGIASGVTEISDTDNNIIYDETNKYLKVVNSLTNLTNISQQNLLVGDIYYVYDITDLSTKYTGSINLTNASHYFMLMNIDSSNVIGGSGWVNISKTEFNANGVLTNPNGIKILYLESIIDTTTGNNPHVGYGKYDDGEEYLNYFRQLFKYSVENNNFSSDLNGTDCTECKTLGFDIGRQIDNKKTWFFVDTSKTNNKFVRIDDNGNTVADDTRKIGEYNLGVPTTQVNPEYYTNAMRDVRETNYKPITPETGRVNYDESAANSLINVKTLAITNNYYNDANFTKYLNDIVLPYLKQVIPSTTILLYDLYGQGMFSDGFVYLPVFNNAICETTGTTNNNTGYQIAIFAKKQLFNGTALDVDGNPITTSGKKQAIRLLSGQTNPSTTLYDVEGYYDINTTFLPGGYTIKRYNTDSCPIVPLVPWSATLNGSYVLSTMNSTINSATHYISSNVPWEIVTQPTNSTIYPTTGASGNTRITVNGNGIVYGDSSFTIRNINTQETKQLGTIISTKLTFVDGTKNNMMALQNSMASNISIDLIAEGDPKTFTVDSTTLPNWLTLVSINGTGTTKTAIFSVTENAAGDRSASIVFKHGNTGSTETATLSLIQGVSSALVLYGTVTDGDTNTPVDNARITSKIGNNNGTVVYTDTNGNYTVTYYIDKTTYDSIVTQGGTATATADKAGYATASGSTPSLPTYEDAVANRIRLNLTMKEAEIAAPIRIYGNVYENLDPTQFYVDPVTVRIPQGGGTMYVTVTAPDGNWTVERTSTTSDALEITKLNNTTVRIYHPANITETTYEGVGTVTWNGVKQTFNVTVSPAWLIVGIQYEYDGSTSNTTAYFGRPGIDGNNNGGTVNRGFYVDAPDKNWTIEFTPTAIFPMPERGGVGMIVDANENTTGSQQTAKGYIVWNGLRREFNLVSYYQFEVTTSGPYTAYPHTLRFPKTGGTQDFTVITPDNNWFGYMSNREENLKTPLPGDNTSFTVTKLNANTIRAVGKVNNTTSVWSSHVYVDWGGARIYLNLVSSVS